jgi:endonuclease YncB( thermonuclease family)
VSRTHSQREEHEADLFAVLCTVPKVMDGDTVHTLADRTGLPLRLAKLRLEYELKKIAA